MLHDHLGKSKQELDGFLAKPDDHFILAGGIWRHRDKFSFDGGFIETSVSVVFDKYFDAAFKKYIRSKSPVTGAFARKSIFELLEPHSSHKFVLRADIRNYFPSITFETVERYAGGCPEINDYSKHIKDVFFYNKALRKGLVASPAISEIIGLAIDNQVSKLIHELGLKDIAYSRYYDDLVFSGDKRGDLKALLTALPNPLKDLFGLELSKKKTYIAPLHGKTILGLVFFGGELSVPKFFKNRLRAVEHVYNRMDESELEDVWGKLSRVGTIIASHHRVISNSTRDESKYGKSLNYYYDELYRLQELRNELLRKMYEETPE